MNFELAIWRKEHHRQFRCEGPVLRISGANEPEISTAFDSIDSQQAITFTYEEHSSQLEIKNHLQSLTEVWTGQTIETESVAHVGLPALFRIADSYFEIRLTADDVTDAENECGIQTIDAVNHEFNSPAPLVPPELLGAAPSSATIASWFETLSRLQREPISTMQLHERAAAAVCQPGGLDAGYVLLEENGEFAIAASHLRDVNQGISFDRAMVTKSFESGRTYFHDKSTQSHGDSIVAAPIFGQENQILGVVHGSRSIRGANQRKGIRALEALWVRLVADAIGAAMQRAEAESRATRTRVLFEQAFSSELVNEILRDPNVLEGQEREVTVLFCDIRESTQISEQLGAQLTYKLLSEVLEYFTKRVIDNGGVIIDYYGDGLAAMWNAPHDQPQHTLHACHAAIAMASEINQLNGRWREYLHRPIRIGVGIHTDVAQVGNAGTSRRLKYGPRGKMVSIASRIESATRDVGVPILLSAQADRQLQGHAVTRHVCRAKLQGISEPVELVELHGLVQSSSNLDFAERLNIYKEALECIDSGDLEEAEQLFELCETLYADAPSRLLRKHARQAADSEAMNRHIVDLT